jgi:flagellar biosynthetic protein FlhB
MSEKTEAPTSRRISEAREQGQVARSQELSSAVALVAGAWLITGPGKRLLGDLEGLLVSSLTELPTAEISTAWAGSLFLNGGLRLVSSMGIILVGLLFTAVAVNVAQTGFLWSSKRIGFDVTRLNPLNGFKRMFSGQGLMELGKALAKLLVVGGVAYSFLQSHKEELMGLARTDFLSGVNQWTGLASSLIMRVGASYLVLALADYGYQRWQHMRSLRMTKEEVKEDMKRSEGDPFIKSRIRGQMRRMARMRMMAAVPKADVIITNPTHLAIAVEYEPNSMSAPKVLAKGAHHVAERIVGIARDNRIPVVQNIPLARAIYRTVEIDQEVPPELYVAMAEVLAYVYGMQGQT